MVIILGMQLILLLAIGLFGVWLGLKLGMNRNKKRLDTLQKENQKRQAQKEKSKEKILELFSKKDRVTNDDVQKLLNVSDATARNYLDELEKGGYLTQHGEEGRGVFYTK